MWPLPRDAGNTKSDPSMMEMVRRRSMPGLPRGTVFAPVLLSGNRIQRRSKSTHFHCNPIISPRRQPVSSNSLIAAIAVEFSPRASSFSSASPTRPISAKERNRSRCCVARSLTPRAGLSARRSRATAKLRTVLSTATLRAAKPRHPAETFRCRRGRAHGALPGLAVV